MLFRIAAGQVEQVDAVEVGHVALRVKNPDRTEPVDHLLIDEAEGLGTLRQENSGFAYGKVRVCLR